jgi:hypothetical protein
MLQGLTEVGSSVKHARVLPIGVLISTLFVSFMGNASSRGTASSPNGVTAAFARLQALAGEWEGKDDDGNPVKTSFKPVASNTAFLETLSMSGMDEMFTLYSIDRDGIALVHYCPTNNQPRMRTIPQEETPQELTFTFQGATNLPDPAVGHQHQLVIVFEDKDHITEKWTWRKNGKDTRMIYRFVRTGDN